MMNFYPFFGSPFYRKPFPYSLNNNSAYIARCETTHNLGCNSTYNLGHNVNYNSNYRLNYNLHNYSNVFNKKVETHCSPNASRSNKQEKFNDSNLSSKNCEKSRNDNFKSTESTCYSKDNSSPCIDYCFEDNYFSDEYFEIFGLKLHFDDLLIICILFFLYQEDVKDTYLYISLVLLLLS